MTSTVCSRASYICLATLTFSGVMTGGRPPLRPRAGSSQPRVGPLTDEVALELGEGSEDVEDEFAPARGGVDVLGQGAEPHPTLGEVLYDRDQMANRATQPVQTPDDDRVALAELVEETVELRTRVKSPRRAIGEGLDAARCLEGVKLKRRVLVCRRNSGISEKVSHSPSVTQRVMWLPYDT